MHANARMNVCKGISDSVSYCMKLQARAVELACKAIAVDPLA